MKFGLLGLLSQVLFILSLILLGTLVLFKLVAAVWPWLLGIAFVVAVCLLLRKKA